MGEVVQFRHPLISLEGADRDAAIALFRELVSPIVSAAINNAFSEASQAVRNAHCDIGLEDGMQLVMEAFRAQVDRPG